MKRQPWTQWLTAALLASFSALGMAGLSVAEEETGMIPVHPRVLWAVMPGKLKTWNLLQSTAENRLGGGWIEARAVREYEKKVEDAESEAAGKGEKPAPPEKARLVITDTGKHAGAIARFEDFSIEPAEGEESEEGVTRRLVVSFPAFQIDYGEDEKVLEILVAERFLVEITIENQPEKFLDEWIRRIDLTALTKFPDSEIVPLPDSLTMIKLDQLNPKKNRAYRLATTSNSRQEKEQQEDEGWLREAIGEVPEIPEEEP